MARHRVALPISLCAGILALILLQAALRHWEHGMVAFSAAGVIAAFTWLLVADRT